MNPPPSLPFLPFPPPNLNATSFPPHPHHIQPPQIPAPSPTSPQLLTATLVSLNCLITALAQTLDSLFTLLPLKQQAGSDLISFPFNPCHRMPPESLYDHYLRCPVPLNLDSSLQSLSYLNTLGSEEDNSHFAGAVGSPSNELCLTLNDYGDFRFDFFYEACPSAVVFPIEDSDSRETFTLPSVLSIECGNFGADGDVGIEEDENLCVGVLPSELWSVQREIKVWSNYPNGYLYNVLRVISGVGLVKESDLRRWVIVNSPRFGVVIDVAMGDHIIMLCTLCLEAMIGHAILQLRSQCNL